MVELDPNPYAAPTHKSPLSATVTRWRIIPAAGSFLLGLVSFAFGIFAVTVMTYVVATQNANETLGGMLAGCFLYLGFGATWMIAGWCYWRSQFRRALAANVVGILVPAVLFAILGV